MEKPSIFVVAGVLLNNEQKVLIARRKAHQDQGGLWEFPGGKCEAGEQSSEALKRELKEELGVVILQAQSLLSKTHEYPNKIVHLEFFLIDKWQGDARGAEGQQIRWVEKHCLHDFQFPAANNEMVARLARE